jgi:argininosuccinate lyase
MWQADQPIEVMAVVTAVLVTLDRLAEDLQVFATSEFGMVELADRHARGSMVMPQKKNPYALAFVRGAASTAIGRLTTAAALGRTPSGQMDSRVFNYGEVPRTLELAAETARLMAGVLGGLVADRPLMARRAREGWAQASDLAETLAVEVGLDYRSAHRVVGRAVRLAVERGLGPGALTAALLDEAARELVGRPLGLDDARVRAAMDAERGVGARAGLGGAAPGAVDAMVAECRAQLEAVRRWREEAAARLAAAAALLDARARELAGSTPVRRGRPAVAS